MTDAPKQYRYKPLFEISFFDDENDCYAIKDRDGNIEAVPREDFASDYEPVEQSAQGWRDIELAPKDGTAVLLTGFIYDNYITQTAERWICAAKFLDFGWFSLEEIATDEWNEIFEPTHWMPLPKPPAREVSQK